jgi:maleylpyruvate isomerase
VSDDGVIDLDAVARDIDALDASQSQLTDALRSMPGVDPGTPTALPGWTVGHVMTHIARNADSTIRMLAGLSQYWKGAESRASDIALGAGREWAALVEDVDVTSDAVTRRMREISDWTGTVQATTAVRPKASVPEMRRREVEIHRVDLGTGYGFDQLPGDFVKFESRRLTMLWQSRPPVGLTGRSDAVLAPPERGRAAGLFGRRSVEGVEPAGVI